jgi:hypothetical protein
MRLATSPTALFLLRTMAIYTSFIDLNALPLTNLVSVRTIQGVMTPRVAQAASAK